jgi:hypothetical protein
MQENYKDRLTSAEIGNNWLIYMLESASICLLKYFQENVLDRGIKSIIKFALDLSEKRVQNIKDFFKKDHLPSPVGFNNNALVKS